MSLLEKKDKTQRYALNCWAQQNGNGTIEAATAFGKTRLGVLAISHYAKAADYQFRALIVTPTIVIQEEWKKEFKKWGEFRVFNECVEICCINTARNFEQEFFDIGVFDEIHNYIHGDINSKVFANNKFEKILGLSAFISDELLDKLENIAPICYSLNVYDALEIGLISEFTIYNIGINLTEYESREYDNLTNSIDYSKRVFNKTAWGKIGKRKSLLYNAANKLNVIEEIHKIYEGKYGIVFSQTKNYANKVKKILGNSCVVHHSGLSQKVRVANLKKFADGRTKEKVISSAKTLDEGITLPRLGWGIISSGSSKEKQMIQRLGRLLRLGEDGKHAKMYCFYCRNTVEANWLSSAQKGFQVININSIKDII